MIRWMLLALLALPGCKQSEPEKPANEAPAPAEEVDWPAAPDDGSQLVARFLGMVGQGDRLGGRFRIFNLADRPVEQVDLLLHYLGPDGKELGRAPFRARATPLIRPKGYLTAPLGTDVPPDTTEIRATVLEVRRTDGLVWKHPTEPGLGPTHILE